MRLGFLHHPVDFVLAQAARRGDRDLLLLLSGHVLGRYVHDAVRIDVEGDLDLRHATRAGGSPVVELAERTVVARHRTLALEHVHFDARLVVRRGRERLALTRRNRRVARNRVVMTPPSVSIPSESGVTSSSSRSLTSPASTPAWIAAPTATTSSGFTPLWDPCRTTP